MPDKRLTLNLLKKTDPLAFAKLCKKAGCTEQALESYMQYEPANISDTDIAVNNAETLYYASELARQLNKYTTAKGLLFKARQSANKLFEITRNQRYERNYDGDEDKRAYELGDIEIRKLENKRYEIIDKISSLEKLLGDEQNGKQ